LYQERNIRRDGVEVLGYRDLDPGPNTLLFPELIGSALFQQERVRSGGNFGLQFRPNDVVDINVTGLYSKFEADNTNQNYIAWGSRALDGEGGQAACPPSGSVTNRVIEDNTVVAGRVSSSNGGTCGFGVVYDAIKRFASAETRNIDFDMNVKPAEGLTLHFKVGYTDAEGNTDAQPFVEFGAPGVFEFDLRGEAPSVRYLPNRDGNVTDPTDPSDLPLIFSSLHQILNEDDEKYVYADALKDLEFGPVKSVKVGAKFTDHQRDLVFNATFCSRTWRAPRACSTRRRASRSAKRRGPVTRWPTWKATSGAVTSVCDTCAPSKHPKARSCDRTVRSTIRSAPTTPSRSSAPMTTCCPA
jgi:iron complex outermembrane receptor protein